ncbi:pyridoxamine 5'-phosphate oxidase family protein [uncultured Enterococcus sp.]|uniref:pyridoxamine 5'-phosphate oxidase family protein n=1 Tax=uncultured Enterococcus sp. TaxID=167972 RepID=UPI002AA73181|nr:pyridoxamine 5'-phosphate oxidase family protein [uncultured Enterococcus sp.]
MNAENMFKEIMEIQQEIALATSVEGQPNVRIVNFLYDPERKVVYFSTFKGNEKVAELQANPLVALTTVIKGDESDHVRILKGNAKPSEKSLQDLAEAWIAKMPFYAEIIESGGEDLQVYEIRFEQATVISGMTFRENITV